MNDEERRKEISRKRREAGMKGAARSNETYEKRRRLKELKPQLEKWIDDVVYDRIKLDEVPEQYREYVMVISNVQKAEIDKVKERVEEAGRLLSWRKRMGFEEED